MVDPSACEMVDPMHEKLGAAENIFNIESARNERESWRDGNIWKQFV